jgi:hypothetical protein
MKGGGLHAVTLRNGDFPIRHNCFNNISRRSAVTTLRRFTAIYLETFPMRRAEHVGKLASTSRVLYLTLHRELFEAIAAGTKKTEYREDKPYWRSRLDPAVALAADRRALLPDIAIALAALPPRSRLAPRRSAIA